MNEKPRRWFQFHLSTAVLSSVMVGLLFFINFRYRFNDAGNAGTEYFDRIYGWTFSIHIWHSLRPYSANPTWVSCPDPDFNGLPAKNVRAAELDALICLLILCVSAVTIEAAIRRGRFCKLHLPTVAVVLITAVAFTALNTLGRTNSFQYEKPWHEYYSPPNTEWNFGWPLTYAHAFGYLTGPKEPILPTDHDFMSFTEPNKRTELILDVIVAVVVVLTAGVVCEYLIRRREGRRP